MDNTIYILIPNKEMSQQVALTMAFGSIHLENQLGQVSLEVFVLEK